MSDDWVFIEIRAFAHKILFHRPLSDAGARYQVNYRDSIETACVN